MLTPESMLMMHTMRHGELLAELSGRRGTHRATRGARARAVDRARGAVAAQRSTASPQAVCCAA